MLSPKRQHNTLSLLTAALLLTISAQSLSCHECRQAYEVIKLREDNTNK